MGFDKYKMSCIHTLTPFLVYCLLKIRITVDMDRNDKKFQTDYILCKKVLLQNILIGYIPLSYLFCTSKWGWQSRELCLKSQKQEMFPGVVTSTCSVMDADMSTSTVVASYTTPARSGLNVHPRSSRDSGTYVVDKTM
jgi:hypothetical protein